MNWWCKISNGFRALFRKELLDREMDEEMRLHLELRTRKNIKAGMSPEEARHAALRSFGGTEQVKEVCRDLRGIGWIEAFCKDLRYGVRMMCRTPGFMAIALVTLGLGIGANTAIFSVVNAVLLRPLPYQHPNGLVSLWEENKKEGIEEMGTSGRNFAYWREQNHVFESMAAWQNRDLYVTGLAEPHQIRAVAVSTSLFSLLGVQPLLGRGFLPEEEQAGKDHVVVLSFAFWRDQLGADSDVVGKAVRFNDQSYTVVGVMPPKFYFPFRWPAPLWMPLVLPTAEARESHLRQLVSVARLKQDITLDRARADMAVVARQLEALDPSRNVGFSVTVNRLLDEAVKRGREWLLLLLGAAGFLLLLACGNVANLLLARATVRQREIAVRAALGASRGRLIRQLLSESLLLSLGGGLAGLLVAVWTTKTLVSLCPATIPRLGDARLDTSVLVFTLCLSVLTGLVFGLAPALKGSVIQLSEALKTGPTGVTAVRRRRSLRSGLAVSQMALALTLLMGCALLVRSLMALQREDLGFRPGNVLTLYLQLPRTKYAAPEQRQYFFEQLLAQARSLPGVRSAALITGRLTLGSEGGFMPFSVDGRPSPGEPRQAKVQLVSSRFFEAMGIRFLQGRGFGNQETQGKVECCVIDENLARRFFAGINPIGERINGVPIVGVVNTVKDFDTLRPVNCTFYRPLSSYFYAMTLIVRTDADPRLLAGALRAQVSSLDKDQPIARLETLEASLAHMLVPRRFSTVLLGLFAGLAALVAVAGVYGLLQYSVTQQTHDIGVRIALGARRSDITLFVLRQGMALILWGALLGLLGAFALTRFLSSLLYGVTPTDPPTFTLAVLLLGAAALVSCWLPARRAAKVDPMTALRYE